MMKEKVEHCLVLCTCGDDATAEKLAHGLVEAQLAACVNIVPGLTSVYSWQGRVRADRECLLIAKTRCERFPQLRDYLRSHHPYELPEIVALPVAAGSSDYLAWIDASVWGAVGG